LYQAAKIVISLKTRELFPLIWLFGALLFGYLAHFCLVIWRITNWITYINIGTTIIYSKNYIKFLEAMGNSYEFVELYD
jgi:hypothetical protein